MLEENDISEAAMLGQEWSRKFRRGTDKFNKRERILVRDFSSDKVLYQGVLHAFSHSILTSILHGSSREIFYGK